MLPVFSVSSSRVRRLCANFSVAVMMSTFFGYDCSVKYLYLRGRPRATPGLYRLVMMLAPNRPEISLLFHLNRFGPC